MFQEFICRFSSISQRIVKSDRLRSDRLRSDRLRSAFIQTRSNKGILLGICLSAALLFTFLVSYSAQADILAATTTRPDGRVVLQSPLSSPIAFGEQSVSGASVNTSDAENSAAVDGVFHQADETLFPISSGKQVNQTSLVLVGAVLVALTMVVGLAIGRKES